MKIALSGCFDLFHEGHKNILKKAYDFSKYGDLLICVNSDLSIKRLKGKNRPIDNIYIRKNKIKDYILEYSDTVCFKINEQTFFSIESFDTEKELLELYLCFKPDMILHGNDIKDVTKVTGHPNFPVLLIDRGFDSKGKRISTTKLIKELNVK